MKIVFILLFFTSASFAQNIPMRTNYGTVYYINIPNRGGNSEPSNQYNFEINLLTDSSFMLYSKVEFYNDSCAFIQIKKNKEKIKFYPSQTKNLKYDDGYGKVFLGIPVGNFWYFKIIKGKINGFSLLPSDDEFSLNYIQKGLGGEYLKATQENVLKLVEGNEKATTYAEKNKLYKAIKEYNSN